MNTIARIIFPLALIMLTSTAFAEDFIIGKVIEHSPDKEIIQLCDTMYKVELVYQNNGIDPVTVGSRANIHEGSIVQVYPTAKTVNYWLTEKVIILTGKQKTNMVEKYGLKCNLQSNQSKNSDND